MNKDAPIERKDNHAAEKSCMFLVLVMKTCLITYHSAYNFGSMLQAYATQEILENMGHSCEIINYRMKEQKDYYSILRTKYGFPSFVKDVLLIPFVKSRQLANERFETFLNERMHVLSEVSNPDEAINQMNHFDLAISGSDQIWNKHSFEMEHNDWKFMEPYLLHGYKGKKISYASSVGGMTDDELKIIQNDLKKYDHLSTREEIASIRLTNLLDKKTEAVLDPTFLLSKEEWSKKLNLKKSNERPYVLYYSLRGYKNGIPRMKTLKQFASEKDVDIKVITPFYYLPYMNKRFEYIYDFGPEQFLEAIYNAEAVISESYHGTILAINFNKDVYSLCGKKGAEYRKTEILKKLGMNDRIIYDAQQLLRIKQPIDYLEINSRLEELKAHSIQYLEDAIER